jgi:hypothetical protein
MVSRSKPSGQRSTLRVELESLQFGGDIRAIKSIGALEGSFPPTARW